MAKMTKEMAEQKITRYLELQEQIKKATEEADALKAELKARANGEESRTLVVGSHTVTVTTASRKQVNAKALAEAHPKIAAKFTKVTAYDTVRIK